MKKPKSFIYSLTFNIVSVTAILLLFFSIVISRIGYVKFTESLTAEYNESAFRTAETAAMLIQNPDIKNFGNPTKNAKHYKNQKSLSYRQLINR